MAPGIAQTPFLVDGQLWTATRKCQYTADIATELN
jgi:hypothetical protein